MGCEGKAVKEQRIWILYFYEICKDPFNSAVAQPSEEQKTQTKGWILISI